MKQKFNICTVKNAENGSFPVFGIRLRHSAVSNSTPIVSSTGGIMTFTLSLREVGIFLPRQKRTVVPSASLRR